MMHLLDVISESMEEYVEIVSADFWQVQECFKEITDCFIFKNCSYRIVCKYGRRGFINNYIYFQSWVNAILCNLGDHIA